MSNTYNINKFGSPSVITIDEGTVDNTSTSLTLTGKGRADYGLHRNRNLVQLLENSAGPSAPSNPTLGQLWYRSDTNDLFLRALDGSPQVPSWVEIGAALEGSRFEVATMGSPTSFYQTSTILAANPGDPTATNVLVFVNGVHQAEGATGNFIYDYGAQRVVFNPGSPSVFPTVGDTIVVQSFGVESGVLGSPSGGGGGVLSFEGRTGVVVAQNGDYLASEVTNDSVVAGATVFDALNTLDASIGVGSVTELEDALSNVRVRAETNGFVEIRSDGNSLAQNRGIEFAFQDGTSQGRIGQFGGPNLTIDNFVDGGRTTITGQNIGGSNRTYIDFDPDDDVQIFHPASNTIVAETDTPANGGFNVNNQNTGGGLERVLTESDLPAIDVSVKTSSTPRTTSTTLTDDPHLVSGSLAPGYYSIEGFIVWNVSSPFTQGIRFNLDVNSGAIDSSASTFAATFNADGFTPNEANETGVADVNSFSGIQVATTGVSDVTGNSLSHGTARRMTLTGCVQVTSTAVIAFEWAQQVSNASATTIAEGSWLRFTRIG